MVNFLILNKDNRDVKDLLLLGIKVIFERNFGCSKQKLKNMYIKIKLSYWEKLNIARTVNYELEFDQHFF